MSCTEMADIDIRALNPDSALNADDDLLVQPAGDVPPRTLRGDRLLTRGPGLTGRGTSDAPLDVARPLPQATGADKGKVPEVNARGEYDLATPTVGDESVDYSKLSPALLADVHGAAQVDASEIHGRELVLRSGNSQREWDIPGITVEDDGTVVGAQDGSTVVNFAGPGVEATALGERVTVTIAGGGGGGSDSDSDTGFVVVAEPGAAKTLTTPEGSAAGAWSDWLTIETTPAITAEQVGRVLVVAEVHAMTGAAGVGGGDRMILESRLVRTRNAAEKMLSDQTNYSPRNIAANAGNTAMAFAEASRIADEEHIAIDEALVGDTYTLQARIVQQVVSGTRDISFSVARNSLTVVPVGRSGGGLTQAEVDARVTAGTSGLRSDVAGVKSDVAEMQEFESALRERSVLLQQTFTVALSNAVALENAIKWPAPGGDAEVIVTIGSFTTTVDVADIVAKPAVGPGDQLSGANAWALTDDSAGVVYWLAHTDTNGVGFGCDTVGSYAVKIERSVLRKGAATWAQDGDPTPIPAPKLINAPTGSAGLTQAEVDARVTVGVNADVQPWARDATTPIPRPKLVNAPTSASVADEAHELASVTALPAVADATAGDLVNYRGELYELVADSEDAHILRGVAGAQGAGRVGLPEFTWAVPASGAPGSYRALLQKSAVGSAPARVYAAISTADGDVLRGVPLSRSAPNDTTTAFAYRNTTDEAGFDGTAGDRVTVEFYSRASAGVLSNPVTVHSADRWERWIDLAGLPVVRPFARGDTADAAAAAAVAALIGRPTAEEIDDGTSAAPRVWSPTDVKNAVARYQVHPVVVNRLPAKFVPFRKYELLQTDEFQPWSEITIANDVPTNAGLRVGETGLLGSPWGVWVNAGAFNLVYDTNSGRAEDLIAPTHIYLDGTRYSVTHNVGVDYLIPGADPTTLGWTAGSVHTIYLEFTGGTSLPVSVPYSPGEYYASDDHTLVFAPGAAAPWAVQGEPRRKVLMDGAGTGLFITSVSASVHTNPQEFSPAYNITATDNLQDLVLIEVGLTMSNRSATTIGFDASATAPGSAVYVTGFTTTKRLRASSAYDATAINGVTVAEADVYNAGTRVGDVRVVLVKSASNNLSLVLAYAGASGSGSFNLAQSVTVFA